jgi:hypothetical protein
MKKIFGTTLLAAAVIAVASAGVYLSYIHNLSRMDRLHRQLDIDGDGIPNAVDADVDGDGIPNMKDGDADGDGTPNIKDALRAAEKLIGRPYDQFNEDGNSILRKMGAIVCMDVIIYSFEKAGIYFDNEMNGLYKIKPWLFPDNEWNNPYDKNFSRRVRNFRVYCEEKGFMLPDGSGLKPGDIIMFGNSHIALIEKVYKDDFTMIESSYTKIFTKRTKKADIYKRNLQVNGRAAFARIKFGE